MYVRETKCHDNQKDQDYPIASLSFVESLEKKDRGNAEHGEEGSAHCEQPELFGSSEEEIVVVSQRNHKNGRNGNPYNCKPDVGFEKM